MNQGTIVQCIGAVVDVEFARTEMPKIYDALKMDEIGLTLEVQQQLGDGVVRTIALGSSDGLRRGMKVVNTGNPITVPVGGKTLGRIMDVLGRPIDERGPVDAEKTMSIHRNAPTFEELSPSTGAARNRHQGHRPHLPVRQGRQDRPLRRRRRRQDRHDDGAHQQHRDGALGPVGVRRRGRAHARGQRLLPRDDRNRASSNKDDLGKSKVAMVYGQMNEPPGNRLRVALTGLTIAESFRDEGRDVLLFIDNIYRFTLAGTECSALLGRMPSAVGYQPTLAEEMGRLQERITSTKTGSITSIQAVYVPADDLTDPSPATTLRPPRRDRRAVARHRLARHLPVGRPARLDVAPGRPARDRRRALQHDARRAVGAAAATRSSATSSRSSAWTSSRPRTSWPSRARARSSASCRSRSPSPKCSPARRASTCRSKDTIKGFKMIVDGECDALPEQAFYMVGTIEQAFEKAKTLQ